MTETTDVAWTIVVRIEDTDRWIDWSTGHRTVPDVLAAAELIVPVSTIAEIRFDRIATARKRFSLADLGATDPAPPSVPADADLRDRIAQAMADAEERLARVTEWVTSDVVTARNEFGNGYREAQRDIRDLLAGRRMADEAQQSELEGACDPASAGDLPAPAAGR
jgi:predicted nucleic acid-binding protein